MTELLDGNGNELLFDDGWLTVTYRDGRPSMSFVLNDDQCLALAVALIQATPSDGGAYMMGDIVVLGDIEVTRDGALCIGLELIRAARSRRSE